MKPYLPLIFVLFAACQNVEKSTVNTAYEIRIDNNAPQIAYATLKLKKTETSERKLYLRGYEMGVLSQVSEVECHGNELIQDADLTWSIPAECRSVNWTISFATHETSAYQPSQQQSLFTQPDWWLISGPSSILRISDSGKNIQNMHFELPNNVSENHELRGVTEPPNYYNLGDFPHMAIGNGVISLNYIGDDLDSVLSIINPEDHLEAIEYLRSILGVTARTEERLNVNWFGAPHERHEASGAAGYDTILANYILPHDNPNRTDQLLTLMLVFHEQFHQLNSASQPIWISESLANYYALKALKEIYPEDSAAKSVWDRFINAERPIDISLLQIESEITNDNNRENYGLLYTQGASFWYELDEELQSNSFGKLNLDNYLPEIMTLDLQSDTQPWQTIKTLFTSLPPSKLNDIEEKYLND